MNRFKDNIKNWYDIADGCGTKKKSKIDKTFKNHLIKPNSMITMIGGTGSGKSTALIDMLSRMPDKFYRIIIFSGSTTDEPLLNFLQNSIDGIELIDNADDLPELTDLNDEDKSTEKLIVFDDINNLNNKEKTKVAKWYNSSRKYGFTCVCMAQNYTNVLPQIRRNTNYFIVFKLNDMNSINQIIKNHNVDGKNKDDIKEAYFESTAQPKNFFMIDLLSPEYRFRHNFLDIMKI